MVNNMNNNNNNNKVPPLIYHSRVQVQPTAALNVAETFLGF